MINLKTIKTGVDKRRRSKDTEYLYATAYIRSIEEKGLTRDLCERMLAASDAEDASRMLAEAHHGASVDVICDEIVNEAYRTVDEVVGIPDMYSFMRYPYDANNIKTAIKCAAKGFSTEGLMFGCATLPEAAYSAMVGSGDYSVLPDGIAEAAKNAADVYAKTGNPQSIDIPIDRACLIAMAKAADATGSDFIKSAVALRIDIANIMSSLRICRMGTKSVEGVLEAALAPAGIIPTEVLIAAAVDENDPIAAICAAIVQYRFELREIVTPDAKLGELERLLENHYLHKVYAAKELSFGCEIPFAYLVGTEYNSKNARMIIAGKRAGLDPDAIRERMRTYYV